MAPVDVAIIGSGINALVAGALLSRGKKRVLVLERESRPGGCMRTEEVTLPGYHHDVMAATFVLFMTSPGYAELAEDLARHGLEFCHSPHPTAVLRPNGNAVVFGLDRAANVAAFNALHAGDGDSHAADVGQVERDAEFLFALLGGPLWSWSTARLVARQAWKRGLNEFKAWIGEGLKPARAWLEWRYGSEDVRALWAPWVLHTGLTPESTYSAQMGKVIAFALEAAGAPVVKGGAARAADALVALIEANGGEVRTGADVDGILVSDGSASGIALASGEEIAAGTVVASVAPGQLYERLLRDQRIGDGASRSAYRHGRGNFQLHYALDAAPVWRTQGLEDVALIHLADSIDSVSKSCNEAERGLLPECPTICVGQPHRLDPTRCPEGKAILWLQIPDAPRIIKGDATGRIDTSAEWTETVREAFADRIEDILKKNVENLDAIKLSRRAFSPADLANLNVNLVGGDPYGGACTLDQFFVFRPFTDSRNSDTRVKNLFQIGASVHPGPGLGGGSGYNLAKKLGA